MSEAVVADILEADKIEWLDPEPSWTAHAKVTGESGLVGYLLTSGEWQEGRFEGEPRRSALLLTSADEDDVREGLSRLTKAVRSHVQGHGRWETKRGRFGRRAQILLPTDEGEWHIGKRWSDRSALEAPREPLDGEIGAGGHTGFCLVEPGS